MNPHSSGASSHGELRNRGCAARKSVHQLPRLKSSHGTGESKTALSGALSCCLADASTLRFNSFDSDVRHQHAGLIMRGAQRGTGESGAVVVAAMRVGRIHGFREPYHVRDLRGVTIALTFSKRPRMVSDASSTGKNDVALTGQRPACPEDPLDPRSY